MTTLGAGEFALLANAGFALETYEPSAVIFAEGEPGDKMYVIRTGEVDIECDGTLIERLAPGAIFGEMALIDGSPRSATARAVTRCEVAPINERSFMFLVSETPFFALAVMRTLANRLRRANKPD